MIRPYIETIVSVFGWKFLIWIIFLKLGHLGSYVPGSNLLRENYVPIISSTAGEHLRKLHD